MTNKNKKIFLAFGGIFTAKLLFVLYANVSQLISGSDALYYLNLRDGVLSGDIFFMDSAAKFVAPVYPWFLSLTAIIFGKEIFWIYVVQAAIGAFGAFLFYRICSRILNPKSAFFAAIFYVLYFPLLIIESDILPSLLSALFILLAVNSLFTGLDGNKTGYFIMSGLFMALATLTRSLFLYAPLAILPLLLFYNKSQWKKYLIFLSVFLLILTPWSARNYYVNKGVNNRIIVVNQWEELKVFSNLKNDTLDRGPGVIAKTFNNVEKVFLYPYRFSFIYAYNGSLPVGYGDPKFILSLFLFLMHFALLSFLTLGIFKLIKTPSLFKRKNIKFFYNLILLILILYAASAGALTTPPPCNICYSYYLIPVMPLVLILAAGYRGSYPD